MKHYITSSKTITSLGMFRLLTVIRIRNTKLNEIKMDPEVLKELKREGKKIVYFDMDGVLNNK